MATTVTPEFENLCDQEFALCSPSKFVLKAICETLGLPYKELLDLANADKIQQQYGECRSPWPERTPL